MATPIHKYAAHGFGFSRPKFSLDKRCVVAQHACEGGASPSRSIPPEQGAFAPPCTPRRRTRPGSSTLPNPARIGCAATACPVASTIREPCSPIPQRQAFAPDTTTRTCPLNPRRLDARQRQERGSCTAYHDLRRNRSAAPDARAGTSAPRSMTAPDDEWKHGAATAGGNLSARPVAAGHRTQAQGQGRGGISGRGGSPIRATRGSRADARLRFCAKVLRGRRSRRVDRLPTICICDSAASAGARSHASPARIWCCWRRSCGAGAYRRQPQSACEAAQQLRFSRPAGIAGVARPGGSHAHRTPQGQRRTDARAWRAIRDR